MKTLLQCTSDPFSQTNPPAALVCRSLKYYSATAKLEEVECSVQVHRMLPSKDIPFSLSVNDVEYGKLVGTMLHCGRTQGCVSPCEE